jgi:hypothetical protein
MRKRIAAFIALLGLLVAAIGFAAVGTGAYFSDTVTGDVDGRTATVELTVGESHSFDFDFENLLPENGGPTKDVTFENGSSVAVDLYWRVKDWEFPGGLSELDKSRIQIAEAFTDNFTSFTGISPATYSKLASLPVGTDYRAQFGVNLNMFAGKEWQDKSVGATIEVIAIQAGVKP